MRTYVITVMVMQFLACAVTLGELAFKDYSKSRNPPSRAVDVCGFLIAMVIGLWACWLLWGQR